MKFTNSQKQAIETTTGNILTIASAGSGKTSVFTERIARMIKEEGIQPNRILAVTFTKKASLEMRERLAKLVGEEIAKQVVMGTFHSIAYILLRHSYPLYRSKEFVKEWWVLKTVRDICNKTTPKNPYGLGLGLNAINDVISYIEKMKNHGYKPNEDNAYYDTVMNDAYNTFEILKNNANYITMTDLIIDFHESLKNDAVFRNNVASYFDRVQIDEFQDTSDLVLRCIKYINKDNVMVVGDFRQSIYSFIGAECENILEFDKHFDNVKLIELQDNFRSTKNIVDFSNRIIENSPIESYKRFKPSKAFKGESEEVKINQYATEEEEANVIVNQIENELANGREATEIAVLLRTNAQIGYYENVLNEKGIKYDVSKGGSFFQYGEVLDIISYIRLAINKKDNTSVRRVINRPSRYITNKLIAELDVKAKQENITLLQALYKHPNATMGRQAQNIQDFLYVIEQISKAVHTKTPKELVEFVINITDYKKYLKDTSLTIDKLQNKLENLNKLVKITSRYKDVYKMLSRIDEMEQNRKEEQRKGIQLMTIHKSKGLEFDVTYVPSVVQEILPHKMSIETNMIEEERRLFYVACSRARERLFVSHYLSEQKENIDTGEITTSPVFMSEFLEELMNK